MREIRWPENSCSRWKGGVTIDGDELCRSMCLGMEVILKTIVEIVMAVCNHTNVLYCSNMEMAKSTEHVLESTCMPCRQWEGLQREDF